MKIMNVNRMKQQTQDFVLRLFIESFGGTPPSSHYTCARCGTFSRLHS